MHFTDVDAEEGILASQISHFSCFAVVRAAFPWPDSVAFATSLSKSILSSLEFSFPAPPSLVNAAEKRVAELNDRFGSWYYVVSAENLAGLLIKRTELEQAKPEPEGGLPERPNIDFEEAEVPPAPPVIEPADEVPANDSEGGDGLSPPQPESADSLKGGGVS